MVNAFADQRSLKISVYDLLDCTGVSEESLRVLHIHLPLRGCEDDHVVKAATLEVVKAATLEDDNEPW